MLCGHGLEIKIHYTLSVTSLLCVKQDPPKMASPAPRFSSGMELGSFVAASDAVTQSLETIAGLKISNGSLSVPSGRLRYTVSAKSNCTIVAFDVQEFKGEVGLVPTESLDKKKFPFIDLLCCKTVPAFSIHQEAAEAFESSFAELDSLYTQYVDGAKLLVITGHSLGGSVASLFTLWLLGRLDPAKAKLPLCITFGAPLTCDERLLKAISQRSIWDSRFVHIVGELDPVPRLLAVIPSSLYKPFGTYLFASQFGCACFNDPDSVITLLKATTHSAGSGSQDSSLQHYDRAMVHLKRNIVAKGVSGNEEWIIRPQQVGIASQLEAIGISSRSWPWDRNTDIGGLCGTLEGHEQAGRTSMAKKNAMDPSKRLNDMKINMANLEWYIKKTQEEGTGYYDTYKKNYSHKREQEVMKYKRLLSRYWKEIVAQAEQKPQAEGRALFTRYIGSGTNYRRMVEPLDIADFYRQGGSDYHSNRPEHYTRLEEWLDDARVVEEVKAPRTAACNLTEDSCFWARVEEAIAWCRALRDGGAEPSKGHPAEFGQYVMSLLREKTVSSGIFLTGSSFMRWWHEYNSILLVHGHSEFIWYMRNRQYMNYQ
uniref:Uncharacterized protein n=1 Tax=Kalanchoe fedtschenkoi TaxID=63787 RepID=A0A7N0T2G7_KALFE